MIHTDLMFLNPMVPQSNGGIVEFDFTEINSPLHDGALLVDHPLPVKSLPTSSTVCPTHFELVAPDPTPATVAFQVCKTLSNSASSAAQLSTASANHHTTLLALVSSAELEFDKFGLSKGSVNYERFAELQNHISSISEIMPLPNFQQLMPEIIEMVNGVKHMEDDLNQLVESLNGLEDEDGEIIEEVEERIERLEFEILICKGKILAERLVFLHK